MGQVDSSSRPNHGQFENTRWSVVLEAVKSRALGAPQALAKLCESHWQPLYAFCAQTRSCDRGCAGPSPRFEPEDKLTAEALYDAKWVLLLLRRATERLEEEQVAAGEAEIFRSLKCFLGSDFGGHAQITYKEAARALGIGEAKVTTLIHRLRQRHMQLVREEVESTVLDPKDVNAELHGLCEALVQAEGRIRM